MLSKKENFENYVVLKLDQSNEFQTSKEGVTIKKILSSISPFEFIKLIRYANNDINPRNATDNKIFDAINDSLSTSPELFWLKSKGLVVATRYCEQLERNRVRVSFFDPNTSEPLQKIQEGIMDGGHNAFAIAYYIAHNLFGIKQWKEWKACKQFWAERYDDIISKFKEVTEKGSTVFNFSIPIEIISPSDNQDDSEYCDAISDICDARNNNVQLNQSAKDNQEGFYDYLKHILPKEKFPIIWKPGEQGKIRVEDVVSMTMIPFSYLQSIGKLDPNEYGTINKVSIYSQKGSCVRFFGRVIGNNEFSEKLEGEGKYVLKSGLIKSALDMTEDIMRFFDMLYEKFPSMYNKAGGSFGRIKGVEEKENKNFLFKTIDKKVRQKYSYGYFYPLLCGITELMQYNEKSNTISWIVNPASSNFNLDELDIKLMTDFFPMSQYNPNVIGKSTSFYNTAPVIFKTYLLKHQI